MKELLFDELKKRYPAIKHGPATDCPRCEGTGERWFEYISGVHGSEGWRACLCLFVDRGYLPAISEMIRRKIAEHREEQV